MRFEDLPERPRLAHPFFDRKEERLVVRSRHFGAITLSVRRMGQGPPLVCVHGLMTSSYSFRYVLERLSKDFEVIVFDLPGAGRSDAPDVPYGAEALADLVGETLDALGVTGARVLGNSMGGYLCMWLALRRPDAMSRLVNLHSPGLATPRMHALELALGWLPGAHALVDRLVVRDPERWAFRNVHYFDESLKSLEEAREYAAPLRTPAGRKAFTRYLADTLRGSTMRRFERALGATRPFPVPMMLVYARRDPMVPPSVGERLARLVPEAQMIWLENASHFAHVDAPDAFLDAAVPFLR
jgi:pimeloyl-ACP methyl ester carboxylesterase